MDRIALSGTELATARYVRLPRRQAAPLSPRAHDRVLWSGETEAAQQRKTEVERRRTPQARVEQAIPCILPGSKWLLHQAFGAS
jgi:hypothetical protein